MGNDYGIMVEIKKINPESLRIPTKSYSQGVLVPAGSDFMFVTGQLPQDIDGNIVAPNDVKVQTELVFSRISTILEEGGMSLDDVVKVGIFVKNIKDSKIEAMVKGLGDEVTFEEADKIDEVAASEFDLGYMPSCLCQEGSAKADELSVDSRYVSKYLRF